MTREKNKKTYDGDDTPAREKEDILEDFEQDDNLEEEPAPKTFSTASENNENVNATAEWFVDFDVWEAALEAKFGPDFEQVLTNELGPDWVNKLNNRMINERNFYKVLNDIQENISGQVNTEFPDFSEGDEDAIGFEALGEGEVIFDESSVDHGGHGSSRHKELPNLSDLRKKDFEAAGEQKTPREEHLDTNMLDQEANLPDEQVVLMDRNDYSRMNYFARKELDRHKDDLDTRKVLERKSKGEHREKVSGVNRLILAVVILISLYAVYSLVALPVGEYYEDKLIAAFPADYLFQPSTALHKQGELSRAGDSDTEMMGGAVCFYFLQPSLNRIELNHLLGGQGEQRYSLSVYNGHDLRIDQGPWADTLEVHRFYSQHWPTNRSALLSVPYMSLRRNGKPVLLAVERTGSGLLPGLMAMDVVDGEGNDVALCYVSDNLLHIALAEDLEQGSVEEVELTKQMVFLFSLLEF